MPRLVHRSGIARFVALLTIAAIVFLPLTASPDVPIDLVHDVALATTDCALFDGVADSSIPRAAAILAIHPLRAPPQSIQSFTL